MLDANKRQLLDYYKQNDELKEHFSRVQQNQSLREQQTDTEFKN